MSIGPVNGGVTNLHDLSAASIAPLAKVQKWSSELDPITNPDRDSASDLIEQFIKGDIGSLELSGLEITSLPDIFGDEIVANKLTGLDLENTLITALPDNFNATELKALNLEESQITTLPNNFNAPQLEYLNLNSSQITALPDNFNAPQLKLLQLANTPITVLPDNFIAHQLEELDLRNSAITALPDGFNATELKSLNLEESQITTLPNNFNAPQLEYLNLNNSQITALPDGFNAPKLDILNLTHTPITTLPEAIFQLPRDCTVYIDLSNFSRSVRDEICERIDSDGYNGPRFEFSVQESHSEDFSNITLEEALNKVVLHTKLEESVVEQIKGVAVTDDENANLKIWLSRLFETASATTEANSNLFKAVCDILVLASKDKEFKEVFHRVLEEASTTCGDRISLSVLQLDLQRQIIQSDPKDLQELKKLLVNGLYALDTLETYAHNIVPTLPGTDPIEVYLGLPVKFKDEFNIPIAIADMLYFACSGLKDEHIENAREA